ncbi:hypothetical protein WICPIJ_004419 [Wickerhamomyces pijperi]|uniref:Uncharacterized protein n=1 Tax=Wickerhamomyces pijperi TaxID=599730 RepID=A0A9P8Q815_WICPI|nr:hypothetical protein WICPIJ_004419 [Wickerhamomyces pijperi]
MLANSQTQASNQGVFDFLAQPPTPVNQPATQTQPQARTLPPSQSQLPTTTVLLVSQPQQRRQRPAVAPLPEMLPIGGNPNLPGIVLINAKLEAGEEFDMFDDEFDGIGAWIPPNQYQYLYLSIFPNAVNPNNRSTVLENLDYQNAPVIQHGTNDHVANQVRAQLAAMGIDMDNAAVMNQIMQQLQYDSD